MIDYDSTQYPTGVMAWRALLAAVEHASAGDESEWIEFKAHLDLNERSARPVLAKAIIGFANREVGRAARHLGGRALVIVGLEPGRLIGAPPIDPAEIHDAVQQYLADPAPGWDIHYVEYRDTKVLVVTVDPPAQGDPPFSIGRNGDKVRDGDIYVRKLGKTEPARSADLAMLFQRMQTSSSPQLDIAVSAEADGGVRLFDVPPDWIDQWVVRERGRLMTPLAPPRQKRSGLGGMEVTRLGRGSGFAALGLSDALRDQADKQRELMATFARSNPHETRHEESRTQDEYEAEVDAYLEECAAGFQRLPRSCVASCRPLSCSRPTTAPIRTSSGSRCMPTSKET